MSKSVLPKRLKFSKERLEKLPPPEGKNRATHYDEEVPKLAIRITPAGTKTFYVVRRTGHQTIWFKLGVFPDMTVEQSRKAGLKALAAFAGEDNPAAARRAARGMPTFGEFFKEYGERHGETKKSWRDDQQRYRDYLKKPLGTKKLDAITRDMIGRILSDMDRAKKAGATVNNVRALASSIFGKAIEWSYIKENPVRGIKTRKAIKRDRFVEASELPRFFASVGQEPNDNIRDYLLLSLLTGARRANVLAMRWDQVNLEEGIWRIPDTKNGTPQNVTISPEAKAILESRSEVAEGPFVFPGGGASGHLVEPKAGWNRVLDRDELTQIRARLAAAGEDFQVREGESLADAIERARKAATLAKIDTEGCRLKNLRIHDLRRTLGSWQAKQGASLAIIGKSLNHKSLQTTMIYARLDLDPVRSSVNAATAAITEAATKGAAINTARLGGAK